MNGQFDLGEVTPLKYFAGIAVVLGVLFANISPSDDSEFTAISYVQWQLQTLIPMGLLVLSHLLLHKISVFDYWNPWLKLILSGLLGGLMFSPVALLIDLWLLEETMDESTIGIAWLNEARNVVPPLMITWIAINAPWVMGFVFQRRVEEVDQDKAGGLKERFNEESVSYSKPNSGSEGDDRVFPTASVVAMMPREKIAPLLYFKAELHYIKVVTEAGECLVLFNLRDAIKDLKDKGFQAHRSFWVTSDAIQSFRKSGRQGTLLLKNGDLIPVSRKRMEEAAARFSLDNIGDSTE